MKQHVYNTALYLRLSRDDEEYGDSVSIETQRTILQQYAKENRLHVVDEYVDDGWSGTNFDRPDFKRMMNDVDSGKINCIVTKDLSRFGREHIQMDYYLEFDFPERGIRYIAVTDNEDTDKGLSDFVPFKNLFNEWFAKDTSRKVKAAFKAKFAKGQRIFAYAPIGYRKDPDNKNHLMNDEETRWIIEKIYDLAYHGAGAAKICKILTQEQIPTASWLNFQRYGTFAHIFEDQPESKRYAWTIAQVKSILKDETYIGNSVHYRETNISYKNKRRIRKDPSEWVKIENTHEAIISRDVFDRVQEQIATRRRSMKDQTTQIFSGLVKCADCGWSMRFATNKTVSRPFSYFTCSRYGQGTGLCSNHYVRYDVLYSYVLSRLRFWIAAVHQDEQAVINRLLQSSNREQEARDKRVIAEKKRAEKRLSDLDNLLAKLYEDRVSEIITARNFSMLSQKYQEEQEQLEAKITALNSQLETAREQVVNTEKWVDLVRQYTDLNELTADVLNGMIEKILIHEAVKDGEGNRVQEIEIFYRFVGNIDQLSKPVSLTA